MKWIIQSFRTQQASQVTFSAEIPELLYGLFHSKMKKGSKTPGIVILLFAL